MDVSLNQILKIVGGVIALIVIVWLFFKIAKLAIGIILLGIVAYYAYKYFYKKKE